MKCRETRTIDRGPGRYKRAREAGSPAGDPESFAKYRSRSLTTDLYEYVTAESRRLLLLNWRRLFYQKEPTSVAIPEE